MDAPVLPVANPSLQLIATYDHFNLEETVLCALPSVFFSWKMVNGKACNLAQRLASFEKKNISEIFVPRG